VVAEEAAEAAEAADATAGSLKISAKKRRRVGSPLLVLFETLSLLPFLSPLKAALRVL